MTPIVDVHTHFWDPQRLAADFGGPSSWPPPPPSGQEQLLYRTVLPADFERVAAAASPNNPISTVVVQASVELADNHWVLEMAKSHPSIVGLCGYVEPGRAEFAAEIRELAANPLFRGIRISYPTDEGERGGLEAVPSEQWWQDMHLMAELDLELDVLVVPFTAAAFAPVLELAAREPGLRIVINHVALLPVTGAAVGAADTELIRACAALPNMYMKVSALVEMAASAESSGVVPTLELDFYRPVLELLWECFGEDRLIYASNWPVCDFARHSDDTPYDDVEPARVYAEQLGLVQAWMREKGEAAARKFFAGNAKEVYKWVDR